MNLSKCRMRALYCSKQDIVYSEERVKKFVKKLKESVENYVSELPMITGSKAGYNCFNTSILYKMIDKLAGDKLI